MNTICSLLTRENISLVIAVIGFILSVYNFVHEKMQNRMKINITYKNHFIAEHDHKSITISLAFENLVKNPISISRIYLCVDDKKYDFYWIPQFVLRATQQTNGQVIDIAFTGELWQNQQEAVNTLMQYDMGIMKAVPGFGKTVMALYMIG